jgi:CheY-like chemotaxis protein
MLKTIKKVLLVEDDMIELTMMNRALKDLNHDNFELTHAANGEIALEHLKTFKPNLIILDLSMPKMNGIELLKEIKNDSQLRQIPIVIFTSSGDLHDKQLCYELGASGYIVKPIEYKKYLSTIEILFEYWDRNEHLELSDKYPGDR